TDVAECNVEKFPDGMCFSGCDDVVVGLVLLEHGPHRDNIILRMTPVTPRVQIAQPQLVGQAKLDSCDMRRDFPGDEFFSTPGTFVIEKDSTRRMQVVCLAIIACQVISSDF